jgi:hypothetical protein
LFTLTAAGETARIGFDAKNRCPRNRKQFQDTDLVMQMKRVIRAIVQQASLSVLVKLSLFKFWIWKIVEASMETLGRAASKAPVCLAEFATPKDRSGIMGACANGNVKLIFSSINVERVMI